VIISKNLTKTSNQLSLHEVYFIMTDLCLKFPQNVRNKKNNFKTGGTLEGSGSSGNLERKVRYCISNHLPPLPHSRFLNTEIGVGFVTHPFSSRLIDITNMYEYPSVSFMVLM